MCERCEKHSIKKQEEFGKDVFYNLFGSYLEIIDDRADGETLIFSINYCPECGREL